MTVVVGAAQGIGEGIARHLASTPWTERLVVADINGPLVESVATDLRAAGHDVRAIPVDIADDTSTRALIKATADAERVAIVAGVFKAVPSLETSRADFERILGVNLIGNFFVAQGYAQEMAERGQGSIVAIASIAARMPRMRQAAYCASKAGIRQAMRVLALETVPRGVRINFVSPGPTVSVSGENFISAMTIVCVADAANAPIPKPGCSRHANATNTAATSVLVAAFGPY